MPNQQQKRAHVSSRLGLEKGFFFIQTSFVNFCVHLFNFFASSAAAFTAADAATILLLLLLLPLLMKLLLLLKLLLMLLLLKLLLKQGAGIRTRDSASADRCPTNELHSPINKS